jgi:hypothetical protein
VDGLSGSCAPERANGPLDKSVGQSRNGQRWVRANRTRHNRSICDDETGKAEDLPECINHSMIGVAAH